MKQLCRIIIFALLGNGQAWAPNPAAPRRFEVVVGGDNRPSKRIGQKQRRGGFGVALEKTEVGSRCS